MGFKLKRKKETVAPATTGTSTNSIAPFQQRLFGEPLRRKQPDWCDCKADSCICKKGKCKCNEGKPNFPTKQLDRPNSRIGGSWSWEPPKPRCLPDETWDDESQSCSYKKALEKIKNAIETD